MRSAVGLPDLFYLWLYDVLINKTTIHFVV